MSLAVDANGKIRVLQGGAVLHEKLVIAPVEPPAMVSWSPTSNAFFINDGEGSGMTSVFRMFRIENGGVFEEATIRKRAVAFFRKTVRCRPQAYDPDVWGFGWSADGREIYLLVQSTVHNPCGPSGTFISLIVGADDAGIRGKLSASGTERRFRSLLPAEIFRK